VTQSRPTTTTTARTVRPTDDRRATVRTDIDLNEFDGALDDAGLRRLMERARLLASKNEGDIESLLASEPEEPATLKQALAELPRLVSGRRMSGTRAVPEEPREGVGDAGGEKT
jgi:hypothetical protein